MSGARAEILGVCLCSWLPVRNAHRITAYGWMQSAPVDGYSQLRGTVWKEHAAQDLFSRKLYFNRKQNWRRNGVLGGVTLAFLGGGNR